MGLSHSYLDHVVLLGCTNSGKSTLFGYLANNGKISVHPPTVVPQESEMIEHEQVRIRKLIDFGGFTCGKRLWKEYLVQSAKNMSGIVFCVDCSNSERFEEARNTLKEIMAIEEVKHVPILIFGTCSDRVEIPGVTQYELDKELEIDLRSSARPMKLFYATIADGSTIIEGFKWLMKTEE